MDSVVHAAAIFPKYALLDITVEQWDRIHAVNLRGTMLVMREAIRHMRAAGRGGSIVNISSVSGERELVFHNAAYGASKAGMTNLTRVAALEFGGDKIRVNAVLPGGTATEGAMSAAKDMVERGLEMKGPITLPGRVPLGMMGAPEDVAAACLFFASPASKQITGQSTRRRRRLHGELKRGATRRQVRSGHRCGCRYRARGRASIRAGGCPGTRDRAWRRG